MESTTELSAWCLHIKTTSGSQSGPPRSRLLAVGLRRRCLAVLPRACLSDAAAGREKDQAVRQKPPAQGRSQKGRADAICGVAAPHHTAVEAGVCSVHVGGGHGRHGLGHLPDTTRQWRIQGGGVRGSSPPPRKCQSVYSRWLGGD